MGLHAWGKEKIWNRGTVYQSNQQSDNDEQSREGLPCRKPKGMLEDLLKKNLCFLSNSRCPSPVQKICDTLFEKVGEERLYKNLIQIFLCSIQIVRWKRQRDCWSSRQKIFISVRWSLWRSKKIISFFDGGSYILWLKDVQPWRKRTKTNLDSITKMG